MANEIFNSSTQASWPLVLTSCKCKRIWKFDFEYEEEYLEDYCHVYFQRSKSLFIGIEYIHCYVSRRRVGLTIFGMWIPTLSMITFNNKKKIILKHSSVTRISLPPIPMLTRFGYSLPIGRGRSLWLHVRWGDLFYCTGGVQTRWTFAVFPKRWYKFNWYAL